MRSTADSNCKFLRVGLPRRWFFGGGLERIRNQVKIVRNNNTLLYSQNDILIKNVLLILQMGPMSTKPFQVQLRRDVALV